MTVSFEVQGGPGGNPWDDGVFSTIRRVVIYHGDCIEAIQIEYQDKEGNSFWSAKHGGTRGVKSEVALDYPDEYLISIHGYRGDISEYGYPVTVVRSLTLETNRETYGPFGVEEGTKISFPTTGAKIVGLHGKSGWYLDSIGLHLVPIPK